MNAGNRHSAPDKESNNNDTHKDIRGASAGGIHNDKSFGSFIVSNRPYPMSGHHFGGPSIGGEGQIQKTFILDTDKALLAEDDAVTVHFAQSHPGGFRQACANIASQFATATGRIYLEICQCADPDESHADPDGPQGYHFETNMSGFWIEGARFVTSAHFLEKYQMPEDQKIHTVTYLQSSSGPYRMKAAVSAGIKVQGRLTHTENAIPVYLLKMDRESDLAIFKPYDDDIRQPTSILRNDIGIQAHHNKSQGLFTVGYYTTDVPVQGLTIEDEKTLQKFWPDTKPATYFPVKYASVSQKRDDAVQFKQIFEYPNYRTISMGKLGHVFSDQQLSTFMSCDMSAWFGGSGGMVGGFVQDSSSSEGWKPMVFGVLRGDKGRQNAITAFTVKGVEWLFN